MWYWSKDNTTNILNENENKGGIVNAQQIGKTIFLTIPENTLASEIALLPSDDIQFSFVPNDSNKYEISLTQKSHRNPNSYLHVAGFDNNKRLSSKNNKLSYRVDGEISNDSKVYIYYHFVNKKGVDISKGSFEYSLKPIPEKFSLYQNYPNPFNSFTKVKYDIPEISIIDISIYDLAGRKVAVLMNGTILQDITRLYGMEKITIS